jgi:hypothetical protein
LCLATGRHNEGIFDLVRLRASDQKGDEVLQILFASGVQQCGRHRHQSELVRQRLLRLDDCFKQVAFAETIADGGVLGCTLGLEQQATRAKEAMGRCVACEEQAGFGFSALY